jgi:antitoxin component of RelBE/YafQ-DinJ toxin-antitoxin module
MLHRYAKLIHMTTTLRSGTIRARIDQRQKQGGEALFDRLGVAQLQAVNLIYVQKCMKALVLLIIFTCLTHAQVTVPIELNKEFIASEEKDNDFFHKIKKVTIGMSENDIVEIFGESRSKAHYTEKFRGKFGDYSISYTAFSVRKPGKPGETVIINMNLSEQFDRNVIFYFDSDQRLKCFTLALHVSETE